MVFFCCNGCGETLKKQKVEQHGYNCASNSVSCIDCNVNFRGSEFKKHTQCVSEAERYQGHLYRATENKGAMKQNTWMESVRGAAENCRNNAALRGLLVRIGEYDNVPRKQAKFLNFIRNSMRVNNRDLVQSAWDAIEAAGKAQREQQTQNANQAPPKEEVAEEVVAVSNGTKKKKRKRENGQEPEKKKKKPLDNEYEALPENLNHITGVEPETPGKAKKYKMVRHIEEVVTKKEVISVKKLKRKVMAAYLEYHPEKGAEEASLLFDKKIYKIPGISVAHGNVTLASTEK